MKYLMTLTLCLSIANASQEFKFKEGERVECQMTKQGFFGGKKTVGWAEAVIIGNGCFTNFSKGSKTYEKATYNVKFKKSCQPNYKFNHIAGCAMQIKEEELRHPKALQRILDDEAKAKMFQPGKKVQVKMTNDDGKLLRWANGCIQKVLMKEYQVAFTTQELKRLKEDGVPNKKWYLINESDVRERPPTMEALKNRLCNYMKDLKRCYRELLHSTKGFTQYEKAGLKKLADATYSPKFDKFRSLRSEYKNIDNKCLDDHKRLLELHDEKLREEAIGKSEKEFLESRGKIIPEFDAICKEYTKVKHEAKTVNEGKGFKYDFESYYFDSVVRLQTKVNMYRLAKSANARED